MNAVMITGASRGIGKALAEEFKLHGYNVIKYERRLLGDIRDPKTVIKLRDLGKKNNINILINCAGVYSEKELSFISLEKLKEVIEVNLIGPMLLTQSLWEHLISVGGTVININSVAGRVPNMKEIAYRTSKIGLAGFSACLSYEGALHGVRILDIPLGGVNTDMLKYLRAPLTRDDQQPEEAAKLIFQIFNSQDTKEIEHFLLNGKIIDNIGMIQ